MKSNKPSLVIPRRPALIPTGSSGKRDRAAPAPLTGPHWHRQLSQLPQLHLDTAEPCYYHHRSRQGGEIFNWWSQGGHWGQWIASVASINAEATGQRVLLVKQKAFVPIALQRKLPENDGYYISIISRVGSGRGKRRFRLHINHSMAVSHKSARYSSLARTFQRRETCHSFPNRSHLFCYFTHLYLPGRKGCLTLRMSLIDSGFRSWCDSWGYRWIVIWLVILQREQDKNHSTSPEQRFHKGIQVWLICFFAPQGSWAPQCFGKAI